MFYFHQKSTTFVKESSLAWAPFLKWTNFRKVQCIAMAAVAAVDEEDVMDAMVAMDAIDEMEVACTLVSETGQLTKNTKQWRK